MEQPAKEIVAPQKEEKKQEVKEVKKEEKKAESIQEEPKGLKPKRVGYSLFTASAVIKTANGKFSVTRIVEEKTEKMVRAAFEKAVKNDLGKARSVTKFYMKPYAVGDENITEEIIEKPAPMVQRELTLQEKALEILCTSPYVHLYKMPTKGNKQPAYLIGKDKDEIVDIIKEHRAEARRELQSAFMEGNQEVDEEAYEKTIRGIRQMSGTEIKNDRRAIKSIYERTDESLQNTIKDHENSLYKETHKEEIVMENFKKAAENESLQLYVVYLREYKEETKTLIISNNEEVAQSLAMYNDTMANFLEEHNLGRQIDITTDTYNNVGLEGVEGVASIEDGIKLFLSKDNLCTQAFCDPELTMDKYIRVLDTIKKTLKMTKKEKSAALEEILKLKDAVNGKDVVSSVVRKRFGGMGDIEKRIIGAI